jgi:hypothetical protein
LEKQPALEVQVDTKELREKFRKEFCTKLAKLADEAEAEGDITKDREILHGAAMLRILQSAVQITNTKTLFDLVKDYPQIAIAGSRITAHNRLN